MRSEAEIMSIIMSFVRETDEIREAILNGSRANPNAKRDPFQDYDVACFVRNVQTFVDDRSFLAQFGEILIMQTPEDMSDPPAAGDGHYGYLMQFADGNRIDLSFLPVESASEALDDSLTVVLVDKDGLLGDVEPASEKSYLPIRPTEKAFEDCCNEFWWVSPYVAKGLWRREITYAKSMMDLHVRPQLMKMLEWYFGTRTEFSKSAGKLGKNLKAHLEPALWEDLEKTYSDSSIENTWSALFAMGELYRVVAHRVAAAFRFTYHENWDENVTQFLERIRALPADAHEF